MTDRFIYEADGLRVTWTRNKDGGWIPTATRILGKNEAGALRGQHSKELETAIEFSIPLLRRHINAKKNGGLKKGKTSHPYKQEILLAMSRAKATGSTLRDFLDGWINNPIEDEIKLEALEEGKKYQISSLYNDSPLQNRTYKTFENYWGICLKNKFTSDPRQA